MKAETISKLTVHSQLLQNLSFVSDEVRAQYPRDHNINVKMLLQILCINYDILIQKKSSRTFLGYQKQDLSI